MTTETHRRACEARQWLRLGYNNPMDIKSLRARIVAKRGDRAAEQLISDMRVQWGRRSEWMEAASD